MLNIRRYSIMREAVFFVLPSPCALQPQLTGMADYYFLCNQHIEEKSDVFTKHFS